MTKTFIKKTKMLSEIQKNLQNALCLTSKISRIGKLFILSKPSRGWSSECIYAEAIKHDLIIEVMMLDDKYFVGLPEHAYALQEAFGGEVKASRFVCYEKPLNLWVWHGDESDKTPLALWMLTDALF